jgi:hypothetical protein
MKKSAFRERVCIALSLIRQLRRSCGLGVSTAAHIPSVPVASRMAANKHEVRLPGC